MLRLLHRVFLASLVGVIPIHAAESANTSPQQLITDAIAKGDASVTIPPGVYRLDATLQIVGASGLEVNARDVTFIMTRYVSALNVEKSKQVAISGLTIDYDPLPFTQGVVTSVSEDARTVSFRVHDGYPALRPDAPDAGRHIFDPATRRWKEGANVFAYPEIKPDKGGRSGQALFEEPQPRIAVGDLIALDWRRLSGGASAIIIRACGAVTLEDMWLRAAPGLAICVRSCDDRTTLRRVRIAPGPTPEGASEARLLSTDADAANLADCRRGPLLEDCDFSFMGDDSLNVHGRLFPIARVESPTSLLVPKVANLPGDIHRLIRPGDTLRLMEKGSFAPVARGRIASVTVVPGAIEMDARELAQIDPKADAHPITKSFRITLAEPVPGLKEGQWFDVPEINCPGYEVRNNYFHDHRARGLRLMGNDGVVEGNRFERISSAAIQVGGEFRYWREAGWVENLLIKNNAMKDIGFGGDLLLPGTYTPGVIAICGRTDTPAKAPGNQRITIEGNTITNSPVAAIYAYSVSGLVVRNNTIRSVNQADASAAGRDNRLSVKEAIEVRDAVNPVVEGNTVE